MDERRRYVRLDTRLQISYTVLQKEKETRVSETMDISGGGIRVLLLDPVPLNAPLQLTIALPDNSKPIVCFGKVVWVEEFSVLSDKKENRFETGVAFTDIDSKDRDRIIQYVILGYASLQK